MFSLTVKYSWVSQKVGLIKCSFSINSKRYKIRLSKRLKVDHCVYGDGSGIFILCLG